MKKQAESTVLEVFPYKNLSKCNEATNYVELAKVQNEVYKNLTAIDSMHDRMHRHLGLAMDDSAYTNRTRAPFVEIAVDLGPYDLTIGVNARAVAKLCWEAEHQEQRTVYNIQQ
eukprot:8319719-Ditylum_brightwellii.AAC.2